jgi:hypothetical protein
MLNGDYGRRARHYNRMCPRCNVTRGALVREVRASVGPLRSKKIAIVAAVNIQGRSTLAPNKENRIIALTPSAAALFLDEKGSEADPPPDF